MQDCGKPSLQGGVPPTDYGKCLPETMSEHQRVSSGFSRSLTGVREFPFDVHDESIRGVFGLRRRDLRMRSEGLN